MLNESSIIDGTYVPAATQDDYGEFNMYGPLREVALGYEQNMVLPEVTGEIEEIYGSIVQPELLAMVKEAAGRPIAQVHPEYTARLESEAAALREAYEAHGVTVQIARAATPEEIALVGRGSPAFTQMYAAEPIWIVGRNVMENAWASDIAWAHLYPLREVHQPYIDADPAVRHFTAPIPTAGRDYSYEGGDVINFGDGRVLVAASRSSTNARGAEWVRRMLAADGYRVDVTTLPDVGIHHLFAVMCPAGPDLVIAYEDSFPDGLPVLIADDFDVIWANREETIATGPCAVMIDPTTILMPTETPRLNDELCARGLEVVTVPFSAHSLLAGGLRCKTSVIRRAIS